MTEFPRPDDGLTGLEPVLDALAGGLTTALHVAVAAELRLWAAACRGMAAAASVHKPSTDPIPSFDGGRVAVYGAMAEWLDRRAAGLADVAGADEESGVAEFLESIRPAAPAPAPAPAASPATASWVPGDLIHPREPEQGRCSNAICGTAWMPADVETCPECGIPVKKPVYNWTKAANPVTARAMSAEKVVQDADLAATEVASYLAFQGGLTPAVQEDLRVAFRRMIDEGRVVGQVLVGDHLRDDATVPDWAWMERS